MHDAVLARIRRILHHQRAAHGEVDQTRTAGQLFGGDFSASTTAGQEFGGSRLGLGVMHDLEGEVVSVHGRTWRIPVEGTPIEVGAAEGIAFGVAAHGGREHRVDLPSGRDTDGILEAIDAYLRDTHVDHEHVVCAVEIAGEFAGVTLRTVAPPTRDHETLGEIIDDETRFQFPSWTGTLVGFRFPDHTGGDTIPGLHLHGLSADLTSGGHVRTATTRAVTARIWVDELVPIVGTQSMDDTTVDGGPIDFARYEGRPDD